MTWSVYQHWDPVKVCVVGRSYKPGVTSDLHRVDIKQNYFKEKTQ
jgi:hypothetical protein